MKTTLPPRVRRSFRTFCSLSVVCWLLAAGLSRASAPAESAPDADLSVVAWNIEWYPGKKNFARGEEMRSHAQAVQEELRKINPDVLLAQEMRDWDSFARLTDAVPGLRPAVVSAFTSRRTGEYWRQQLAIASKLPVLAAWSERWQAANDLRPPRGFAAAMLRLPGPGVRHVLVYSLHLKSNLAEDETETEMNFRERDESIRQLLGHIREMKETAFKDTLVGVIVGGDFNTNQDGQFGDKVMQMMKEAGFHHTWDSVPRADRATWRGNEEHETATFDHIFTLGLGRPRAELLEVPLETGDHRPVRIILPADVLAQARPLMPAAE